jgi:hypothetical protein
LATNVPIGCLHDDVGVTGLLAGHEESTACSCCALQAQTFMLPQLKELLTNGTYQPAPGSVPLTLGSLEVAQAERTAKCRVILTAEQTVPYLDGMTTVIKVIHLDQSQSATGVDCCLRSSSSCASKTSCVPCLSASRLCYLQQHICAHMPHAMRCRMLRSARSIVAACRFLHCVCALPTSWTWSVTTCALSARSRA